MRLDLDRDRPELARLVAAGVAAFTAASPRPLARPVTRIDLDFDLTTMDFPCVWVHLDTDPTGHPDTGTSDRWQLLRKWYDHWAPACHAACDGEPVTVVAIGRTTVVEDEDGLKAAAGAFFVALLTGLRDIGTFHDLPRATNCYLGVGSAGGGFGWPAWEDRGPANMV